MSNIALIQYYNELNLENPFLWKHYDICDLKYIVDRAGDSLTKEDWRYICRNQKLDSSFLYENEYYIDWTSVSINPNLTEDIIYNFPDKLNWEEISSWYPLTPQFVDDYMDYIDFFYITFNETLTVPILKKIYYAIDWRQFSSSMYITEEIIRAFPELVSWSGILKRTFSEEFYREFLDYFDLYELTNAILGYQEYNELLRELKDKIDWDEFKNQGHVITMAYEEVYEWWLNNKEKGKIDENVKKN